MKALIKKNYIIYALFFILMPVYSYAALTAVNMTIPSPTTRSDGRQYYCESGTGAPITYTFTLSALDPAATDYTAYNYFQFTIPTGLGNLVINCVPGAAAIASTTVEIGGTDYSGSIIVTPSIAGAATNPTVTVIVRFSWLLASNAQLANAARNLIGEVQGGAITLQDTRNQNYGIIAGITVVNFAQNNEAADGYVNPTRAADFDVTGTAIYDIPGYNLETAADALPGADVASVTLRLQRRAAPYAVFMSQGAGTTPAFTSTVLAATPITANTSGYVWYITAAFAGGGTKDSPGAAAGGGLALESNYITLTNIRFYNGIGLNPPAVTRYYRRYGASGTLVELTASTIVDGGSGTAMHGNTVFTVRWQDALVPANQGTFTVTINSGSNIGIAVIPYDMDPGAVWFLNNSTRVINYSVTAIAGSQYGTQYTAAPTSSICWDRNHAPINNAVPISIVGTNPTATSLLLTWTPIQTRTNPTGYFNEDFYEYRVYFRRTSDPPVESIWGGADDATLRGLANNPYPIPLNDPVRHFDPAGYKYTTITNLDIYTEYQFKIAVVDVFGNEISTLVQTIRTLPFSVEASVTDGIARYSNTNFVLDPNNFLSRPLRESNISVEMNIVTAGGSSPDIVRVWFTNNMGPIPIVAGAPFVPNTAAFTPPNYLEASAALKTGPNKWVAYLPTTSPIIKLNNGIRFIVETQRNGISVFTDLNTVTDNDPNNNPWLFHIGIPAVFLPYPTRILNNVLSAKMPCCFPAYYLLFDALVTIKVYDVRGRLISVVLENSYRRGGQNIKENGWCGRNSSNKRLGAGLYYMHIKAVTVGMKTLIDKYLKVVISH